MQLVGSRPPDEIPSWLAAADIFVLPSRWEGVSFALMEAMASGLPAMAIRVSGMSQLIPDDDRGRVVPVDAMWMQQRRLNAARASEWARQFSWDACFSKTAELLREIATAS